MDWKKKTGSRKFWARITAVITSMVVFTSATPEAMEGIVALIGAIGGLSIYMLSEGSVDSKPVNVKVDTKEIVEKEEI